MKISRLSQDWLLAASDLDIDVIAPFKLILPSNNEIDCDALVKNFGYRKGMIVISDFEKISAYQEEIVTEGYGYSTLSEPEENWIYDRDSTIELLKDWGWNGKPEDTPVWFRCSIGVGEHRVPGEDKD